MTDDGGSGDDSNENGNMGSIIVGHGGSMVKFSAFRPEGHRFKFHYSSHVGTLGKSFTLSCL